MLTDQRQSQIRAELAEQGSVVASSLAARFGVSEDTIRRDLRDLAKSGECSRVYGGAILRRAAPLVLRHALAPDEKAALAQAAVHLIRPHQTLFIDAGSTNLAIARALPADMPLTVATNALAIATVLAERSNLTLILLGGRHDHASGACTGAATLAAIAALCADLFFLGTCGLDPMHGATAFDAAEAEVKRAMAANSASLAVAATAEKLCTHAPHRIAPLAAIDHLITQNSVTADVLAAFHAAGARLHLA